MEEFYLLRPNRDQLRKNTTQGPPSGNRIREFANLKHRFTN